MRASPKALVRSQRTRLRSAVMSSALSPKPDIRLAVRTAGPFAMQRYAKKIPRPSGGFEALLSRSETSAGCRFRLDCRAGCHVCQGLAAAGPDVGRHLAVRSCVPGPAADRPSAVHHAAGRFGHPAGAAGRSSDLAFRSYGCSFTTIPWARLSPLITHAALTKYFVFWNQLPNI